MPTFVGYDPGGNGKHGVAILDVGKRPVSVEVHTAEDGQGVLDWIRDRCSSPPTGIGIDTLLTWEVGKSGWRGADLALRARYPQVGNSVTSPNSLYGSMCIQGPAVALGLRETWPKLGVTETHPKVLYFALADQKYDWSRKSAEMTRWLVQKFDLPPATVTNDHEWDALASACAAWCGFAGLWRTDLVELARNPITPIPDTKYFWPEPLLAGAS